MTNTLSKCASIPMEIKSHASVGGIRFDESRDKVRQLLGSKFEEFRRAPCSVNTSDHYVDMGCFIYYDEANKVEAIELSKPAKAIFNGVDLLDISARSLIVLMTIDDSKIEMEPDGFVSRKTGISAYIPDADAFESRAESILVFRAGYYGN